MLQSHWNILPLDRKELITIKRQVGWEVDCKDNLKVSISVWFDIIGSSLTSDPGHDRATVALWQQKV